MGSTANHTPSEISQAFLMSQIRRAGIAYRNCLMPETATLFDIAYVVNPCGDSRPVSGRLPWRRGHFLGAQGQNKC